MSVRNAARVASNDDHKEICGIFFERTGYLCLIRKQNRRSQTGEFGITRKELREAQFKSSGIWGIFHSHPISEANPSVGDVSGGPYQGHAIIYDLIGDEFRLWRITRRSWHLVKSFDFDRSWLLDSFED